MTVRRCRRCHQVVGTNVSVCPHCAVSNPTRPDKSLMVLAVGGAALAMVAIWLVVT